MDDSPGRNEPTPIRRPRRWRRFLALGLFGLIGVAVLVVAGLPAFLGTNPGQAWLLGRANRVLAPSSLHFDGLSLSWSGPTRLQGFVIRDAKGEPVVEAPVATWDRTLWQFLFERPVLGTLELTGGNLDIERDEQGTIDLVEAIRPLITNNPRTDLKIRVRESKLRFRTPEFLSPVTADAASVDLVIAPRPNPLSWELRLRRDGGEASSLNISGFFDRWAAIEGRAAAVRLELNGKKWPVSLSRGGVEAVGLLEGGFELERDQERWSVQGESTLQALEIAGPRLAGDRLRLDPLQLGLAVSETVEGWEVARLDLQSPLFEIKGQGVVPRSGPVGIAGGAEFQGRLDLAGLARQLPKTLALRKDVTLDQGQAELRLVAASEGDRPKIDVSAKVTGLRATRSGQTLAQTDPATLQVAWRADAKSELSLDSFSAETPFFKGTGRPRPDGTLAFEGILDLGTAQAQLRELVDLGGVEVAGTADWNGTYRAEGPGFLGRLETKWNGLRLRGIGPAEIRRDEAVVVLEAQGPLSGSRRPSGWSEASVVWSSGDLVGEARVIEASRLVTARTRLPLRVAGQMAEAEARLSSRWKSEGLDIERLVVSLVPTPADAGPPPIRIAARGRFDRAEGLLTLLPLDPMGEVSLVGLSPEGVRIAGVGLADGPRGELGLFGSLDGLERWIPALAGGGKLQGRWSGLATARPGDAGLALGGRVEVDDLALIQGSRTIAAEGPVTLNVRAIATRDGSGIDLPELVFATPVAALETSGRLVEAEGRRRLELDGRLLPEWDEITKRASSFLEPGATLRGRPHPVRLRTDLDERWQDSAEGVVGLALDSADLYGMKFGPTSVVARLNSGALSIDPIDAEINNGRLHLEPEWLTDVEGGGPRLALGPESWVSDVAVNDVVSHRVLSFVAPVLDNATRVRGRVSADLDEAVLPLQGEGTLKVEGRVVFQDLEFLPGEFLDPLMGLLNRSDRPLVRLDEPVSWSIADRRVHQKGLSIPVGKLTRIGMEGWVDFDRNLNLTASIPVVPTALADKPLIGGVLGDASVRVPIRGTLDRPKVDGDVFGAAMKDLGKTVLERSVTKGAVQLLDRITRPRDPGAPPLFPKMLTPEERKARRLEKQEERRKRRFTPSNPSPMP